MTETPGTNAFTMHAFDIWKATETLTEEWQSAVFNAQVCVDSMLDKPSAKEERRAAVPCIRNIRKALTATREAVCNKRSLAEDQDAWNCHPFVGTLMDDLSFVIEDANHAISFLGRLLEWIETQS
jgi:hypothetical protein